MGQVWNTELPPNQRLVLLAYADRANDDGGSVFPGEAELLRKTGYKRSSIRHITALLIEANLLIQTKRGQTGQRAEYVVNVPELVALGNLRVSRYCTLCGEADPALANREGARNVSTGCKKQQKRVQPTGPQTSVIHQEPSVRSGAALATVADTKIATVKRNELWGVLTVTHGEPVTKSEKSHRGKIVNDLFLAGVTPEEYPILVKAYVSKWKGNQPGPASVANRVG